MRRSHSRLDYFVYHFLACLVRRTPEHKERMSIGQNIAQGGLEAICGADEMLGEYSRLCSTYQQEECWTTRTKVLGKLIFEKCTPCCLEMRRAEKELLGDWVILFESIGNIITAQKNTTRVRYLESMRQRQWYDPKGRIWLRPPLRVSRAFYSVIAMLLSTNDYIKDLHSLYRYCSVNMGMMTQKKTYQLCDFVDRKSSKN